MWRSSRQLQDFFVRQLFQIHFYSVHRPAHRWMKRLPKKLAKIAGINLEEQAQAMFKAGSSLAGKTAEDICFQDFKQFTVNDMVFGVGQLNSMSKEELQKVKEMLTPYLPKVLEKNGVQMVFFMLTDILDESTELLCCGARAKEYIIDVL